MSLTSRPMSLFVSLYTQVSCGGCHMIVLAYPRLQNGEMDSASSNEEDENENLHKHNLNHSIKMDGTVDLGGSFGARDRRRQESIKRVNIRPENVPRYLRYQDLSRYLSYQTIPRYQRYWDKPICQISRHTKISEISRHTKISEISRHTKISKN